MAFEKSVLKLLNADETSALITEPDRLRRWAGHYCLGRPAGWW